MKPLLLRESSDKSPFKEGPRGKTLGATPNVLSKINLSFDEDNLPKTPDSMQANASSTVKTSSKQSFSKNKKKDSGELSHTFEKSVDTP